MTRVPGAAQSTSQEGRGTTDQGLQGDLEPQLTPQPLGNQLWASGVAAQGPDRLQAGGPGSDLFARRGCLTFVGSGAVMKKQHMPQSPPPRPSCKSLGVPQHCWEPCMSQSTRLQSSALSQGRSLGTQGQGQQVQAGRGRAQPCPGALQADTHSPRPPLGTSCASCLGTDHLPQPPLLPSFSASPRPGLCPFKPISSSTARCCPLPSAGPSQLARRQDGGAPRVSVPGPHTLPQSLGASYSQPSVRTSHL